MKATINLSILDFKLIFWNICLWRFNSINLSILDFKY